MLHQLWGIFSRRERFQAVALLGAMIVRAAFTMVGVASIMPFMSVVADPEMIRTNEYLARAYDYFGFTSDNSFMIALGVGVIVMIVLSNGINALTTYGMVRFNWGMGHRMSMRLLEGYMRQPYSFFVERNSAGLHKTLLDEINVIITKVVKPTIDIGARLLMVIALVVLIILIDPMLALVSTAVLGGAYGTLYSLIKRKQRRLGEARVHANRGRFKTASEAFGGIKDVKILHREKAFVRRFQPASWQFAKTNASNAVVSQLPNYLLDTIAFGGIITVVLYFLATGGGVVQVLPILSLYAFAGYRLLPEVKTLFSDLTMIRFNRAALDEFLADYQGVPANGDISVPEPLPFEREIVLEDVTFFYPGSDRPALDQVSFRIGKNETIGLIGPSGSGKTTLVDVLLGLYRPREGQVLVDGVEITDDNLRSWQRNVGYVPQFIFLTDDTIAANIAFGMGGGDIDMVQIERAAKIAHLHDFIMTLPEGYATVVGERGVRLSGGQRQRIGIARALFHDPDVLIMDEATSALDGATESAVMEAINELGGRKTIVLIAHRHSTLGACSKIVNLEHGRLQGGSRQRHIMVI